MIGPISSTPQTAEAGRIQLNEPDRASQVPGQSGDEAADRNGAALDEASANRSVIVEQAEAILSDLRDAATGSLSRLRIEQDEDTGNFVYKSVHRETGEILKEWPPEEVRKTIAFLDKLRGAVVDQDA